MYEVLHEDPQMNKTLPTKFVMVCLLLLSFGCRSEQEKQTEAIEIQEESVQLPGAMFDSADGWWTREALGNIEMGQTEREVRATHGAPEETEGPLFQGATGLYEWTWRYKEPDLQISFSAQEEDGPWTISALATTRESLKTRRGVHVGAPLEAASEAYGDVIDAENFDEDLLVAGSLYGGVIFTLKDNHVESIFIGASAE